MSRSKIYLLDVNVLLAITTSRHQHHTQAAKFADAANAGQLGICRVTQMGLLRLLTNTTVMSEDVLTAKQAWALSDSLLQDDRFRFIDEPKGLDHDWRRLSSLKGWGPSRWTDDYLIAFAKLLDLRLLTFDAGAQTRSAGAAQLL